MINCDIIEEYKCSITFIQNNVANVVLKDKYGSIFNWQCSHIDLLPVDAIDKKQFKCTAINVDDGIIIINMSSFNNNMTTTKLITVI